MGIVSHPVVLAALPPYMVSYILNPLCTGRILGTSHKMKREKPQLTRPNAFFQKDITETQKMSHTVKTRVPHPVLDTKQHSTSL